MSEPYHPPFAITSAMLHFVAEIGEWIGRYTITANAQLTPHLRRSNRIRTIQASLAIENNTLSIEQVTAILDGKSVLGLPREIQEVRNAFAAYERLNDWESTSRKDLLEAHGILMAGLVDRPGAFRSGGVGIMRGNQVIHMAPPANRVAHLTDNLLNWLKHTDAHPLVSSSVFHCEFEFIHPFSDGNGRLGRLWQTLILHKWHPLFACLPVETLIHAHQHRYYQTLALSDNQGEATPFVEFMLEILRDSIVETATSDHVNDHVSDHVIRLLSQLEKKPLRASELMRALGFSHRPSFRKNHLEPALAAALIEMTQPEAPRSPTQRYRLTEKGIARLKKTKRERNPP